MNKYAVIVAGGTGSRMKVEVPKQFMLLSSKPVILYSIEAFVKQDPSVHIILVIHPEFIALWEQISAEIKTSNPVQVITGGKTRFESVKNGLNLIEGEGLVAVHDAARPLIDADFIEALFSEASTYGSAIPVVPLTDTIRAIDGDTSHQQDRKFLRAVQTPQVFKVSELQRAYTQPYQTNFTDDGSVLEAAGFPLHLTEGRQGNIKITHLQDIAMAEALITSLTT